MVPTRKLRLLQWNLTSASPERLGMLINLIRSEDFDGALLQETRWHDIFAPPPKIPGFTVYTKCRTNPTLRSCGGGVAIILRDTILSSPRADLVTDAEAIWVDVHLSGGVTLLLSSIYIPPGRHGSLSQLPLQHLRRYSVLAGDYNAHSPIWDSECRSRNPAGTSLERLIDRSDLYIHQTEPTHYSPIARGAGHSTIDLALTTSSLSPHTTVSALDELDGYHRPLEIVINLSPSESTVLPTRKFWRLRRADPESFRDALDSRFADFIQSHVASSNDRTVKDLTDAIREVADENVGKTCIRPSRHQPWWRPSIASPLRAMKHARRRWQRHHRPEDRIAYTDRSRAARAAISTARSEYYSRKMRRATSSTPVHQLFRVLTNTAPIRTPVALRTVDGVSADPDVTSSVLQDTFSCVSQMPNESPNAQQRHVAAYLLEHQDDFIPSDSAPLVSDYNLPFTTAELDEALGRAKDGAPGSDDIHNWFLRNSGPAFRRSLLFLFNRLMFKSEFPRVWKEAIIHPIPKPGRDHTDPSSFRPISLLSCVGKIYERLIYARLYHLAETKSQAHIRETHRWISNSQAGFRVHRSTVDQLLRLVQNIEDGFAQSDETIAVMLDLSKAYDMIWHDGLLYKLHQLGLRGHLLRVITDFLKNRSCRVRIADVLSSGYSPSCGVPQGSVLSTLLFILYINDVLDGLPHDVSRYIFADDITLSVTSASRDTACSTLNIALQKLHEWSTRWLMSFSASKTSFTIFSKSSAVYDPSSHRPLQLDSFTLRHDPTPRLLGLRFDSKLRWTAHVSAILTTAQRKLNLIRLFSGIRSVSRTDIRTLYVSILRPTLEYASCIWSSAVPSLRRKLTCVQNSALRLMTGAAPSTPISVLQAETSIAPLGIRWDQNLIRCVIRHLRLSTGAASPFLRERSYRSTPCSPYSRASVLIRRLYPNNVLPPDEYPRSPLHVDPPWRNATQRTPKPFATTFKDVSKRLTRVWHTYYAADPAGAAYRSLRPTIRSRWSNSDLSTRSKTRCIFRLRTSHCNLGACQRGRPLTPCPMCGNIDTVGHLLFECPAFAARRSILLNRISTILSIRSDQLTLQSLIGAPDVSSVNVSRVSELVAGYALSCRPLL